MHRPRISVIKCSWILWVCFNTEDRTADPRSGQDELYVHIHRPNITGFVLLHPQLSVFGWIHILQELVDGLNHLERY